MEVHMDLRPGGGRISHMEVTNLDEVDEPATETRPARRGYRISWKTRGMIDYVLRSERVTELMLAADGGTNHAMWETFYGTMGGVIASLNQVLLDGSDAMMDGLKEFAEMKEADKALLGVVGEAVGAQSTDSSHSS